MFMGSRDFTGQLQGFCKLSNFLLDSFPSLTNLTADLGVQAKRGSVLAA